MIKHLEQFTLQVWNSPVFMTWGGMGSRLFGLLVLLPLVMNRFSAEETAVWFLFSVILSLQTLMDFGFATTFVRFVAYSNKSQPGDQGGGDASINSGPGAYSNRTVIANMRYVYARLSVIWFAVLALLGSLAVAKPISAIGVPSEGWIGWIVLFVSSSLFFRGSMHISYLRGMEQVALHQRWEILIGACTVGLGCIVLLSGGGLIALVVSNQLGGLVRFLLFRRLALGQSEPGAWKEIDDSMFNTLWSAVWRSGLGVLATFGTIQMSGVLYAQLGSAREVAAYLLALQLIQRIRLFAYVPFSVRIPNMSRMYANGERGDLLALASRSMLVSIWVFFIAVLCIGFTGDYLLQVIGSNIPFVPLAVWWVLTLAFLFDLVGAIHLQLYSTTNQIVWHIANGVSGVMMLLLMPFAYHLCGLMGLPLAMLAGYVLFYTPYSIKLSYRAFAIPLMARNVLSLVFPVVILVTMVIVAGGFTDRP